MLSHVFSPLKINCMDLHNRVLMSSMHLNFEGEDKYQRMAQFYALRAQDGPGLIVTAGCSPDAAGRATADGFCISSDSHIESHRIVTSAVHAAGESKIALQLLHFGREAFHGRLVAPSALRLPGSVFTPAALTYEEIVETIDSYARAARRAVIAGYDAIELLFSQGFLIHQFLSAHTNLREDEWGGDFKARMRFALRVAAAVREAVGTRFPIVFRVPCMDLLNEGLSFDDSMTLIDALSRYQIDLLNISIGWHESNVPTLANVVPQAGFASTALRVKRRFPNLLTSVSNRINDLRHGEELLIDGVADVIAMGRPFLADRRIVAKSRRQQFEDINQCIGCNQNCLDQMFLGHEVGCSVNPECGQREDGKAPPPLPADTTVAVVGGGLAGMAAALYLRRRGAQVTLFERSRRLGGQMLLAAKIPTKEEFANTVYYYERQLFNTGVNVVLGREFGTDELANTAWSHVVIATGTEPNFVRDAVSDRSHPALPGLDQAPNLRVLSWRELLERNVPVAFPVVIYGGGGVACDIAKLLQKKRSRVAISEQYMHQSNATALAGQMEPASDAERRTTIMQRSSKKIGHRIGRTTRWITIDELTAKGVNMLRGTTLVSVYDGGVVVTSKGKQEVLPAKTLILATGQHPEIDGVCKRLIDLKIPYTVIGAANANPAEPASISSSVHSGYAVAMGL